MHSRRFWLLSLVALLGLLGLLTPRTTAGQVPFGQVGCFPQTATVGQTVFCAANIGFHPQGSTVVEQIEFGDGTVGGAAPLTHAYSSPGTYTVRYALTICEPSSPCQTYRSTTTVTVTGTTAATASITVDRGNGATYFIGDPITICFAVNVPGITDTAIVSVVDRGPGSTSQVVTAIPIVLNQQACVTGTVGPPVGTDTVSLIVISIGSQQVPTSAQLAATTTYVIAQRQGQQPPSGGNQPTPNQPSNPSGPSQPTSGLCPDGRTPVTLGGTCPSTNTPAPTPVTTRTPQPTPQPQNTQSATCLPSMAGVRACAAPTKDSDGRVVIFVPGIVLPVSVCGASQTCEAISNASDFTKLVSKVPGLSPVNEIPFSYAGAGTSSYTVAQNHQDIATSARALTALVRQAETIPEVRTIDIVSHSLGGVITAYAMEQGLKNDSLVKYAIAVDSPLRGVALSAIPAGLGALFHRAGLTNADLVYRDLSSGSDVIKAISSETDDGKFYVMTNWDDDFVPVSISYLGPYLQPNVRFWTAKLGDQLDNLGHGGAFKSDEAYAVVASIIKSGTVPAPQTRLLALLSCLNVGECLHRVFFGLFSPANILVTAPDGRRAGYDPATGAVVNEIPGAVYTGQGSEPQFVLLPDSVLGQFQVTVTGTGMGTYTLLEQHEIGGTVQSTEVVGATAPGLRTIYGVQVDSESVPQFGTSDQTQTSQGVVQGISTVGAGAAVSLTVSVDGCGNTTADGVSYFQEGETVIIIASPCDDSYVFAGWSGDVCDGQDANPCVAVMPGTDARVLVSFRTQ